MKNIIIVVAGHHNNMQLGQHFETHLRPLGLNPELIKLEDHDLPLYTPKQEAHGIPTPMQTLLPKMQQAAGFVFAAPEYNGGIPPVLTNFIAWISRSGDSNWRGAFNNKPAIVASHSGGGGIHVTSAMRLQLSYLGINVLGRQIVVNASKPLNQESVQAVCQGMAQLLS
jgi:chromate reductase, NAD(P)H dehydrogenase (quinone)